MIYCVQALTQLTVVIFSWYVCILWIDLTFASLIFPVQVCMFLSVLGLGAIHGQQSIMKIM